MPGGNADPLAPVPKADAQHYAEAYLTWYCAKHAIELPENDHRNTLSYAFHFSNGECFAYISRKVPESRGYGGYGRHGKRVLAHSVEEAKIRIPAWAMPCRRVDLWHAAHQAGADLTICDDIANSFNTRTDDHKAVCAAAADMDAPTFGMFLADRDATQKRERTEQIERNRIAARVWFDEEYARKTQEEGADGLDLFNRHDGWDRASLAKNVRNDWLLQARHLSKDNDVGPERVALCVARARLFHRHSMAA